MLEVTNLFNGPSPFILEQRLVGEHSYLVGQVKYVLACFDTAKKGKGVDSSKQLSI